MVDAVVLNAIVGILLRAAARIVGPVDSGARCAQDMDEVCVRKDAVKGWMTMCKL